MDSPKMPGRTVLLDTFNVDGVRSFTAFRHFEFYSVVFTDFLDEAAVVNEHIFLCLVGYNESKAFGLIEELYSSGLHVVIGIKSLTDHIPPVGQPDVNISWNAG